VHGARTWPDQLILVDSSIQYVAVTQASLKDDPPPVPPVQPELEDCCNSGCNPCVFDLYQSELERYRTALAEWQDRQTRQAQASANSRSRARRAHADKPARPRS